MPCQVEQANADTDLILQTTTASAHQTPAKLMTDDLRRSDTAMLPNKTLNTKHILPGRTLTKIKII